MISLEGLLMFFIPFSAIVAYSFMSTCNERIFRNESCNEITLIIIPMRVLISYGLSSLVVFTLLHTITTLGSMIEICCQDAQWDPTTLGFDDVCAATNTGMISGVSAIGSVLVLYIGVITIAVNVFILTELCKYVKNYAMNTMSDKLQVESIMVVRTPTGDPQFVPQVDEV